MPRLGAACKGTPGVPEGVAAHQSGFAAVNTLRVYTSTLRYAPQCQHARVCACAPMASGRCHCCLFSHRRLACCTPKYATHPRCHAPKMPHTKMPLTPKFRVFHTAGCYITAKLSRANATKTVLIRVPRTINVALQPCHARDIHATGQKRRLTRNKSLIKRLHTHLPKCRAT